MNVNCARCGGTGVLPLDDSNGSIVQACPDCDLETRHAREAARFETNVVVKNLLRSAYLSLRGAKALIESNPHFRPISLPSKAKTFEVTQIELAIEHVQAATKRL
jgi:hypothetical protein